MPVDRSPDPGAAIEFARRAAEVMSDRRPRSRCCTSETERHAERAAQDGRNGPSRACTATAIPSTRSSAAAERSSGPHRDADEAATACLTRCAAARRNACCAAALPGARGTRASAVEQVARPAPLVAGSATSSGGRTGARATANSLPRREVAELAFSPIHAASQPGSERSNPPTIDVGRRLAATPRASVLLGLLLAGAAAGQPGRQDLSRPHRLHVDRVENPRRRSPRGWRRPWPVREHRRARLAHRRGPAASRVSTAWLPRQSLTPKRWSQSRARVRADAANATCVVDVQTQNPDVTAKPPAEYFRKNGGVHDPLLPRFDDAHGARQSLSLQRRKPSAHSGCILLMASREAQTSPVVIDGIATAVTAQLR